MAEPTLSAGAGSLCRLILYLRLAALGLTVVWLPTQEQIGQALAAILVVAMVTSVGPLLAWDRVVGFVERHPAALGIDLVLAVVVLSLVTPQSPFFYFVLGTAALGGVVHGWTGAAVFGGSLVAAHLGWAATTAAALAELTFQQYLGLPGLILLVAVSGAAVRGVLDEQRRTREALDVALEEVGARRERERIARDLHDSVGKTLHGLALRAEAVGRAEPGADAERLRRDARSVAADARQAANEARDLLGELRGAPASPTADLEHPHPASTESTTESVDVVAHIRDHIQRWAATHRVTVATTLDGPLCSPEIARELVAILGEALENVARHAAASRVEVRLECSGEHLQLSVRDDGRGVDGGAAPDRSGDQDGFGLSGMRERAVLLGGDLVVDSPGGQGTEVRVAIPTPSDDAATSEPARQR